MFLICFTQSGQYDNELEEKPFEFSHSQNWREIAHFGHSLDARVLELLYIDSTDTAE